MNVNGQATITTPTNGTIYGQTKSVNVNNGVVSVNVAELPQFVSFSTN